MATLNYSQAVFSGLLKIFGSCSVVPMKLPDWLEQNSMTRRAFAEKIGVTPSYVTLLCSEGSRWPGMVVAMAIDKVTHGKVTALDFYDHT
jgi:hypothetical protein